MSATGLAATYLARRAAQKERVRILYRRALKDALNWAVHRHIFYESAQELRDKFEANRYVEDLDTIDRMVDDAEATFNKMQHPDPYIVPWAPGGSKFTRNPAPTPGLDIGFLVNGGTLRLKLSTTMVWRRSRSCEVVILLSASVNP
ncbi:NADH dehydrogenase [ubiquinone] 1 beta subcomplex subunit 9 isoform X3 [Amborella trichopoda]|uniref:NADH dehydrogenase [ubiquinone] 1 beta subcomplex subunit 9 isoform X3 n=1 Tax=Amborella trichopoda TaxID=13333 RepID=UPI0005D3A8E5|nr:NADH dehydrogenase [ubiquinone] 1 beta subcomplex subunit 9 isoform X3 [Amborella trichopoda]|eukprot:XP_011627231.1 NADH dehydrogenase [ubiquinone] 1 beta subcomplex subunit 9 isoform X3 [Amborella trichopoda]